MRGLGAVEVDIVVVAMVLWLVGACKKSSGVYGCLFCFDREEEGSSRGYQGFLYTTREYCY